MLPHPSTAPGRGRGTFAEHRAFWGCPRLDGCATSAFDRHLMHHRSPPVQPAAGGSRAAHQQMRAGGAGEPRLRQQAHEAAAGVCDEVGCRTRGRVADMKPTLPAALPGAACSAPAHAPLPSAPGCPLVPHQPHHAPACLPAFACRTSLGCASWARSCTSCSRASPAASSASPSRSAS
mgnify:CR=1 FL=1